MREAAFSGILGGMDWGGRAAATVKRGSASVVDYQHAQLPVPMVAVRKWKTIRKPVGFLMRISGASAIGRVLVGFGRDLSSRPRQ